MKNLTQQEIKVNIDNLQSVREFLFKQKKEIDRKLLDNYKSIEKLKELDSIKFLQKTDLTFKEKVDFLLFEDGHAPKNSHNECYSFFNSELSGLYVSGYFPFNNQKSIQIKLLKGVNCNIESVYNSLNKILDIIKPFNDKGDKLFSLFEYTLSEYESYNIILNKDNEWKLVNGRYQTLEKFESMRQMLDYCQKHHYYQSSLPEDQPVEEDDFFN